MLYLIHQTNTNAYKIGYTKDIYSRMTAYRTHNPYFKLIGIKEGTPKDELNYHTKLNEYRINQCEWFEFTEEFLEEIVKEFDTKNLEQYLSQHRKLHTKEPFSYTTIYEKFQEYLNGVEVEWSDEEINCNNYKMISEYFSKFNKLEANSTRCKLMLENKGDVKDAKGMASNYFKVGTKYSNVDVIKTLQLVYNQIGLKRRAKSKDLVELFQDVRTLKIKGERFRKIIKK